MTTAADEGNVIKATFGAAEVAMVEEILAEHEPTEHRAICAACKLAVTYRPTSSGAGFSVVGHTSSDPELTFGIGANGTPLCPGGHGEMTLADDTLLPAAEAFTLASEQLDGPVQRSLPGIIPAFNFQGAYTEIEAKAVEVEALTRVEEEDHDTYKESKKAREKAADVLTKMILEFRRRRREKSEGGEAGASSTPSAETRCRFEQLHPGVPCPICTDAELLAASTVLPASEEHGVEAKDLLERREIDECVIELSAMGVIVPVETLGALPIDQLSEVQAWSKDGMQNPERREELLASLPSGLGRPCVVAGVVTSEAEPGDTFLTCKHCDGRVASKATGSGEDLPSWPAGTLYGTNCPGKERHRYPKAAKKKATKRRK